MDVVDQSSRVAYLGKGEPLMGFWPYFRHAHESVGVLPSPTPLGCGQLTSASGTVTTRLFAGRRLPLAAGAAVDGAGGDTGGDNPGQSSAGTPRGPTLPSPPDTVGDDAAAPSLHSPSMARCDRSGSERSRAETPGDGRASLLAVGAVLGLIRNPMSPAASRQTHPTRGI